LCPPAEEGTAHARTTADRDLGMADQAIDPDMSTHTRARVPARPMPVHALVVDDLAVVAVDDPAVAVGDLGAVKAAGITVTEHPL
jgi:hypothetical protein